MSYEQRNTRSNVFKRFGQYLIHLNLYSHTESLSLEKQFMSTRVYLFLLAVCMLILLTFANLTIPLRTTTVNSPSLALFDHLSNRYSSTLSCSCSQSVIAHDMFLSFAPQYHQVCSSEFVSQSWISTLFLFRLNYYYPLDFRMAAASQFQTLAFLCRFVLESIIDAQKTLPMHHLLTLSVLSRAAFETQSKTLARQLQTTLITTTNLTDEYVIFSIAQNYLSSSLRTTSFFRSSSKYFSSNSAQYVWDEKLLIKGVADFCFCYQTYDCTIEARLYNLTVPYKYASIYGPNKSVSHVPGMKAGCIPHNSLLNSTLECFYNATCIITLTESLGDKTFPNPLDGRVQSRFQSNMTVRSIFAELFIEDWHFRSNFTGYFSTCAPMACSYSYRERFNAVHVLITFIGFIGGVTVILRIIAPLLVSNIIYRIKRICCNRNECNQQMSMPDSDAAQRLSKCQRPIRDRVIR